MSLLINQISTETLIILPNKIANLHDCLPPFHGTMLNLKVWQQQKRNKCGLIERTYHQILYYITNKLSPPMPALPKSYQKYSLSFWSFPPFLSNVIQIHYMVPGRVDIYCRWGVKMAQSRRSKPIWNKGDSDHAGSGSQSHRLEPNGVRRAQKGIPTQNAKVGWWGHPSIGCYTGSLAQGVRTSAGWDCQHGRVTQCRVWETKRKEEGIVIEAEPNIGCLRPTRVRKMSTRKGSLAQGIGVQARPFPQRSGLACSVETWFVHGKGGAHAGGHPM